MLADTLLIHCHLVMAYNRYIDIDAYVVQYAMILKPFFEHYNAEKDAVGLIHNHKIPSQVYCFIALL